MKLESDLKYCSRAGWWWPIPLTPTFRRLRWVDLWVQESLDFSKTTLNFFSFFLCLCVGVGREVCGAGRERLGVVHGHMDVIGQFSLGVVSFYHDGPSNCVIKLDSKAGLMASSSSFVSLCGSKCSGLMPSVPPVSGQLVVCTLCSCVMKTKQIWLFSAHMLPLLARLCLVPLETIVIINKFAMIFTGLEVLYFLGSNLLVPYNLAKSAYRELVQVRVLGTCRLVCFCMKFIFMYTLAIVTFPHSLGETFFSALLGASGLS